MAAHLQLARNPGEETATRLPTRRSAVVLADDHALMRRSLRMLLDGEEGVSVIAEADDMAGVTRQVARSRAAGARARPEHARRVEHRGDQPSARASARHEDRGDDDGGGPGVRAARVRGGRASGSSSKELADEELPAAVRAAARGEEFVSPRVAARLDALHRALTEDALSAREVEVLRLIALGHTSVEIARKLHLSPRTVETHRANVHRKLGLATRAELVRYALRRGLLGG